VSSHVSPTFGADSPPRSPGARSLSIALIGPDKKRRKSVVQALAEDGHTDVREFESYPERPDDFRWLLEQSFGVILFDLDSRPDVVLDLVERASASNSATVMVYSERIDTRLAVRYMRAGAREFLLLPLEPGIVTEALDRAATRRRTVAQPARSVAGKLLAFVCAKGGCGVTTVACNLAIALAGNPDQRTLLIDLALPIGDAALALGISSKYSTEDAIRNADRLDSSLLKELLVRHRSGLFVLAAPSSVPDVEGCGDAIDKLITVARREFDHVIVDVGSRMDLQGTAIFKQASTVYLVTLTGVSELRNSNRLISQFFPAGGPNLEVVINRFESQLLGVNEDVVTQALGRPVRWKLPEDRETARERQFGEIGMGDTRIARLSLDMASAITGRPIAQEKKKGFSLKGLGRSVADKVSPDVPLSIRVAPPAGDGPIPAVPKSKPVLARSAPEICWTAPAPMAYGDALSPDQLNATTSVAGALVYTPGPGSVLPAGTHTLSVSFTPEDSGKYTTAQATVPLNVEKSAPAIAWPAPQPIPYGAAIGNGQLCATASVPGRFDYSPAPGTVLAAGTHPLSVEFTPADTENYTNARATVSLAVARAVPSLAWPAPKPIECGTRLSARQLCATASVPGKFHYAPAPGVILPAGTHRLSVEFTPADTENYVKVQAAVSLTISAAKPAITWPEPKPIEFGTRLSARQLCATASVPGTFDYSPALGAVLPAGTHRLSVEFTPADTENYDKVQAAVSLTIAAAKPAITWPELKPIEFGTRLSARQLCATAAVLGKFEYSSAPGKVLEVGVHALKARFTPSDTKNYTTAEAQVQIVVEKAKPVLAWPSPDPFPYGTPLSSKQLCATASIPGKFEYSPPPGALLPAGIHALTVSFTPSDNANYTDAKARVPLEIVKAAPALDWPAPEPIVVGSRLSDKQLCATASVPGKFDYSPAPGAVLALGTHRLSVTFTPADSANYVSAQAAVPLTFMAKATPAIAWPKPDAVPYGTPLSSKQLCATASVPGKFGYSQAPGAVLPAGIHALTVSFTPSDNAHYADAKARVSLEIVRAAPALEWPTPEPIVVGSRLSDKQLRAKASVPGKFDYSPAPGAVLAVGKHRLSVTFTPADSANYATAQAVVPLTIMAKATPAIAWPKPDAVPYGTPLSSKQLCATASVPGKFEYSPAPGAVLAAGAHTLRATFIPEDGANYAQAEATVSLQVTKAAPNLEWPAPKPIIDGTVLGEAQLCASASVAGRFEYTPPAGVAPPPGAYTLSVNFIPRDGANYAAAQATVPLTVVAKAMPAITWAKPAPISYGTILGSEQLCATASVPGSFEYRPRPGEVLPAGTQTLSAKFTPSDTENYATVEAAVPLRVERAAPAVEWPSLDPVPYGVELAARQLCATASVPGHFDYSPAQGAVLPVGRHTLSAAFIPEDGANYTTAQATVSIEVTKATPGIEWPAPQSMPCNTPLGDAQLCATSPVPGNFDYTPGPGHQFEVGTHTLSVTFTPKDTASYHPAKASVSIKAVAKPVPVLVWPNPDPIRYGTPLSARQLCATASVPGKFQYSAGPGEVLPAGTHTLAVNFIPGDQATYAAARATVSIQVEKAIPHIDWPAPKPIKPGTPLSDLQLNAGTWVAGNFVYSPAADVVLPPGTHTLSVTFQPADSANYHSAQATVTLKVAARAVPVIAWQNPAPIRAGTALGDAQLCATASAPGTFHYSPRRGEVLEPGMHTLSVTFVPEDPEEYLSAQATATLQVETARGISDLPASERQESPESVRESALASLALGDEASEIPSMRNWLDVPNATPSETAVEADARQKRAGRKWRVVAAFACLLLAAIAAIPLSHWAMKTMAQGTVAAQPILPETPLKSSKPKHAQVHDELIATAETVKPTPVQSEMMHDQLTAPTRIPHNLQKQLDADAPSTPPAASFSTAALGGSASGGGMSNLFAEKAPQVVASSPSHPLAISPGVAMGLLIKKTLPLYPQVARQARISGTVRMKATISKTGTIDKLELVSGPETLRNAALDAVRTWRYKPYIVDNEPQEIETTISLTFSLGS
jgi:TonB family protein